MARDEEMKRLKDELYQNEKIIRFASSSLSLENLDEETIQKYREQEAYISEMKISLDEVKLRFGNLEKETESSVQVMQGQIKLHVKKEDVVQELNTELLVGTEGIVCRSKFFLVDTENFKVTKESLYAAGMIYSEKCTIGGIKIEGDTMENVSGTIVSGTVNTDHLDLKNAWPQLIDFNAADETVNTVRFTSFFNENDLTQNDATTQSFVGGTLRSEGAIYATAGWNGQTDDLGVKHGTDYNLVFERVYANSVMLQSSSGYRMANRLRCYGIYSESQDDYWSDRRLKDDIEYLELGAARELWKRVRPVRYRLKRSGVTEYGYIAQEIKEALEHAGLDGIVAQDNGYMAIAYPELITLRILQIQDNEKKLERMRGYGESKDHGDAHSCE